MGDSSVTRFLPPVGADSAISCAVCGCRLMPATGGEDGAWRHFPSLHSGRDARGCRPHCVDALHDRSGRILALSPEPGAAAA
ncbi:MAG: hypothetical protein M3N29_08225 [Chloroflexota bacterium]|nr:hypothetical protein [Chloroflexota bacterium]